MTDDQKQNILSQLGINIDSNVDKQTDNIDETVSNEQAVA